MKLKEQLHRIHSSFGPRSRTALEYLYALVPSHLRRKRGFRNYLEFLRKSQWESADWHVEYQNGQLGELVKYAASNSPYYKKLFTKLGINANDFHSVSKLRQLPILQKFELIDNLDSFLPKTFPKENMIYNSTSGSTGHPFRFSQDYYAVMREEAFAVRHWENAGMKLGEPTVYLRSYIPGAKDSLYRYSPVHNRHYFSAYHLDSSNLKFYLNKIRKSGAKFIFGYPSSLEILADLLKDSNETLSFHAAITGSEKLSQSARLKIQNALNTKVYDWYGLAEPTVTMGQCSEGSYHLFSEYGILELLDANDVPVTTEGETGRIVGTNFTNRALPLIRYDTGDLGTFTTQKCNCGRSTPVVVSAIEGRKDDLLIGANGQYLPSVNFYTLFAHLGNEVQRFQLVQKEKSKFAVKLVRGPEFGEQSVKAIIKGLHERVGGKPEICIEDVKRILPTSAGKIRAVVREYDPVNGSNGRDDEN